VDINQVTGIIVEAAFKVHMTLGPGLLETVYEAVLGRRGDRETGWRRGWVKKGKRMEETPQLQISDFRF
jgi:hypothetical protein